MYFKMKMAIFIDIVIMYISSVFINNHQIKYISNNHRDEYIIDSIPRVKNLHHRNHTEIRKKCSVKVSSGRNQKLIKVDFSFLNAKFHETNRFAVYNL